MSGGEGTESVPPDRVRHGDVVHDPASGRWLTVTRIVGGELKVTEAGADMVAEPLWTCYGDERLDEVLELHGEGQSVLRQRGDGDDR